MMVYDDDVEVVPVNEKAAAIREAIARARRAVPGIRAHGALVSSFTEASELAQGLADAAFARNGADAWPKEDDPPLRLLMHLAGMIEGSWQSGCTGAPPQAGLARAESLAGAIHGRAEIRCKIAEGYAFYALYPEAYLAAARSLPRRTLVVGIRSIGVGLAALVAAGAGAAMPVSVRPVGHPFRRMLALSAEMTERLARWEGAFAIVDEGPGLSGSSFGAVADFLEESRVARDRLHFLPSHAGDLGPEASERHRSRWQRAARHVVDFDTLFLSPASKRSLPSWVEGLTGPVTAPLEDISGGSWRHLRFAHKGSWPPAHTQQEKRKFLLRSGDSAWLLKFAGLSRFGEIKLPMAERLAEAGFSPPVAGLRHGFLVERWLDDAKPLELANVDCAELLRHIGRYLVFRATRFPAASRGASAAGLLEMAKVNALEALGPEVACRLDRWVPRLDALERIGRPIRTDGRLHAWEWLVQDGRLIKTDAVDHHAAHDLVGCQSVAWDVAGAIAEFRLSDDEAGELRSIVAHATREPFDRDAGQFMLECYLAFQLGYWHLAASSTGSPQEAERSARKAAEYADRLRRSLA